ncbi:MAG: coproporphyrinogen dehydrogenase HemZ [Oscillospiraceae bacterium]|nr:coproporphyrinogen dehydrogenase HemZ [Oscillospiraceae bacterium]
MTLIFSDHKFQYEIERLFRAFFPPIKIALSTDKADAEDEYCLTQRSFDGSEAVLSVRLCADGKDIGRERRVPCDIPEKEQERVMSVLLYKVLSEYTGVEIPWGILTGVRPVKVLSRLSDSEAQEKLLVSSEKIALAKAIDRVQQPMIAAIPKNSFSLYVSIPFCPTRCSYCSFVSHSVDKAAARMEEYIDLLIEEMKQTADIAKQLSLRLDTIYFGGGTPTTLSAEQLKRLFSALDCFDRSYVREFTVEAGRPDTITREKLAAIKEAGADRISVNPQTMRDSVLEAIGRRHTAAQTEEAYALAREVGFKCINMDLIAGLPTDDTEGFRYSLDRVIKLRPENVTVHSLSLKRAATLFHEQDRKTHGGAAEMIDYTHKSLQNAGYSPYYLYRQKNTADNQENTGYALPDTESLYNMFIMEELQTILAVGAGASTKLVDTDGARIKRLCNHKFPYEYLDRFNDIKMQKNEIFDFFV